MFASLLLFAVALNAGECTSALRITTQPASPRQGAFFRLRLSGIAPSTNLTARLGDRPLYLPLQHRDSSTTALAGAAIDDTSLTVTVHCAAGADIDSVVHHVRVSPASYPLEKLRVAPEFASEPDSLLVKRIAREADLARQVALGSYDTPQLWRGPFVPPRTSRITSGFGRGRQYNGSITSRHMGTDFAGTPGAPVRAINRGVVRLVHRFYYGGNVIYVDHGAGVTSAYLHLSAQGVQVGDTVEAGQKVGKVGATGRVTGPHLHLITRYGPLSLDPMTLFGLEAKN